MIFLQSLSQHIVWISLMKVLGLHETEVQSIIDHIRWHVPCSVRLVAYRVACSYKTQTGCELALFGVFTERGFVTEPPAGKPKARACIRTLSPLSDIIPHCSHWLRSTANPRLVECLVHHMRFCTTLKDTALAVLRYGWLCRTYFPSKQMFRLSCRSSSVLSAVEDVDEWTTVDAMDEWKSNWPCSTQTLNPKRRRNDRPSPACVHSIGSISDRVCSAFHLSVQEPLVRDPAVTVIRARNHSPVPWWPVNVFISRWWFCTRDKDVFRIRVTLNGMERCIGVTRTCARPRSFVSTSRLSFGSQPLFAFSLGSSVSRSSKRNGCVFPVSSGYRTIVAMRSVEQGEQSQPPTNENLLRLPGAGNTYPGAFYAGQPVRR